MEKTLEQMKHRESQLEGMNATNSLSLRTAGELDAIRNYGVQGWNDFLKRKSKVSARKRVNHTRNVQKRASEQKAKK